MRPAIIGQALAAISADEEVCEALFEILETQRILASNSDLILVPRGSNELLADLLSAQGSIPARPGQTGDEAGPVAEYDGAGGRGICDVDVRGIPSARKCRSQARFHED